MPFYSLEQYGGDFLTAYYKTVTTRMGVKDSPEDYLKMHLDLVWQRLQARVQIVKDGQQICSVEACEPDSMNYENWGTPNRDGTTVELVNELFRTLWGFPKEPAVKAEFARWKDLTLEIDTGVMVRYEDLLNTWYNIQFSSDPRDSILKRWGQKDPASVTTPTPPVASAPAQPTEQTPVADEENANTSENPDDYYYEESDEDFWDDFWGW
jgi:hypothetical protein